MLELVIVILLTLAFFVLMKIFFGQGYGKVMQNQGLLIFAFGAILLALWLVVHYLGWAVIAKKFAGLVLLIFGMFMVAKFPTNADWQPEGFTLLGTILGLFCTFLGIYWLLF